MQTMKTADKDISGCITDIQRFSVHDGPGIRTTVFFKGCPLRCIWCHNPETQNRQRQPQFNKTLCTSCGSCAAACANNCHNINEGNHVFNAEHCEKCLHCIAACPAGALAICGKQIKACEAVEIAIRDRAFYGKKGGITISGGEPAAQPEFANAILAGAKESGLSTCIQTCGLGMDKIEIDLCDYIYFDIKTMNNDLHISLTGTGNSIILDQLSKLAAVCPQKITVRTVITKGITDNVPHVDEILMFMKEIGLSTLKLIKFHPYGSSKAETVGMCRNEPGKEHIPDDTKFNELEEIAVRNDTARLSK